MDTVPPRRRPRHQDHVGAELADAFDLLVRQAPVVDGNGVHDDGPRPQGGPLGAFGGHGFHHPRHHHLQAAAGAAGGQKQVGPPPVPGGSDDALPVQQGPARQLFHFLDGVAHSHGDVLKGLFHRGRRFAPHLQAVLAVGLPFDEDSLGGGAAAVHGQNYVNGLFRHMLPPP